MKESESDSRIDRFNPRSTDPKIPIEWFETLAIELNRRNHGF